MRVRVIVVCGVVVAVAAAVSVLVARPWSDPNTEDRIAAPVRDELAARVVAVLEKDPAGREVITHGTEPVGCAAHVLGAEPEGVGSATDVREVYAWAVCWTIVNGAPLTGASLPVKVRFGSPPGVEWPADGGGYTSSAKEIFPKRLHDVIFDNNGYATLVGPAAEQRARDLATSR